MNLDLDLDRVRAAIAHDIDEFLRLHRIEEALSEGRAFEVMKREAQIARAETHMPTRATN